MLVQLSIRDIVLIDRLDLAFAPGLSVLTGETGAGKSILLDAFALALGGRGDGSLVRHGEGQGQVTAVFDVPMAHPARAVIRAADIDDDGDVILRRIQHADGRTRAFINDQPVSVQVLKALGGALVEIHGQHDDRALVDPASHRAILDAYGGLQGQAEAVAAAHRAFRGAAAALARQKEAAASAARDADYLRHLVEELAALKPEAGEEEALAARRQAMMQAEKVVSELNEAFEAVAGQASPAPAIATALRRLERRVTTAPALMEPAVKALEAAVIAIDEARVTLESLLRQAEFDPKELERTEERLFALRAAARKYNVASVDDLPSLSERSAALLAAIDRGEQEVAALEAAVAEAEAAYLQLARALSDARRAVAAELDASVMAELAPLKLERARFITQIDTDETARDAAGLDRVEFWVQTNPGTRPGPMTKIASGGELSRFMLALKVVLANRASAPTLVFDEIDTGVGGAVADAIGQRLARLAANVLVISVTLAPPVAARAGAHFLIEKRAEGDGERVKTGVAALAEAQRREEIARMLAGATITDEARAAAQRLLQAAS